MNKEKTPNLDISTLKLLLINAQGLTQEKMCEVEEKTDSSTIFCITETQHKRVKVQTLPTTNIICKMRALNDKKGGGLMVVYKPSNLLKIKEVMCGHDDILVVECKYVDISFKIILVYMSTDDGNRNSRILNYIERLINDFDENESLFLMGDFNGHVGFIGPQDLNKNGKIVINLMEKYNLSMLNVDINCQGVITWSQGEKRSVIDFVLVNSGAYGFFHSMHVDEENEELDFSDHRLITVFLKVAHKKRNYAENFKVYTYLKIDETTKEDFLLEVEGELDTFSESNMNMQLFDKIVAEKSKQTMERTVRRRVNASDPRKVEPIWFNKTIRKEISIRRNINKKRRKAKSDQERIIFEEQYNAQKLKVKKMVRDAIYEHEKKLTSEILSDANRSKNLWKNINKLKGENLEPALIDIYDDEGHIVPKEELPHLLTEAWRGIYQRNRNEIDLAWNPHERIRYCEQLEQMRTPVMEGRIITDEDDARPPDCIFPTILREHFDMALDADDEPVTAMINQKIEKGDVVRQLKSTKNGKAPGPNGLRPDLYTAMLRNDSCLSTLTMCLNKVLLEGVIPHDWRNSNTKLIQKKVKPTSRDLRPIALTNSSYKIYMGILREKIETHLRSNQLMSELQSGSTMKRRTTDNLFMLKYCIDETFKNKKQLFVISIDFQKAFDSVNRKLMIEKLKEYGIDANIINTIAEIYTGDKTELYLNGEKQTEIHVTSGIRQGCNGSTTLFLMITYHIIREIQRKNLGFWDDLFSVAALFYVDDGLLMAGTLKEAERIIDMVIETAEVCGLKINKSKCGILIFNYKNERPTEINKIKVVKSLKYLGVVITDKRKCFKQHIEESISKARGMVSHLYAVLGNCCHRILIGKTFWKGLAMPGFMYASEVFDFDKKELETLQRLDNQAFRYILQLPGYTANAALRGEVGASLVSSRDAKNKILFIKHALEEGTNDLLGKMVMRRLEQGATRWSQQANDYLVKVGLTLTNIKSMTCEQIKKKINRWDTEVWQREMENKSTLELYRSFKREVGEEKWMDNRWQTNIMMRARTNTLKLGWRGDREVCELCGQESETLKHFLLMCSKLNGVRMTGYLLQRPFRCPEDELMADMLLFGRNSYDDCESRILLLSNLWRERLKILEGTN